MTLDLKITLKLKPVKIAKKRKSAIFSERDRYKYFFKLTFYSLSEYEIRSHLSFKIACDRSRSLAPQPRNSCGTRKIKKLILTKSDITQGRKKGLECSIQSIIFSHME